MSVRELKSSMDRREFLKTSMMGAGALALPL